ncbi:MAG: Zn-ribbon domain-containing OB-fold protein [Rhodoglobus sp.]|nr:Zn-ribbon domain-containing OB-fold protein [Rhodoglobus sp.]
MTERYDLPTIEPDSEAWWAGIEAGVLLLEQCRDCSDAHLYPRTFCPVCWSDQVELVAASGLGTVYTFSIVRMNDLPPFAERLPYVVAMIELAEGPRLMSTVVDIDPESLSIGTPVSLRVRRDADGPAVPEFVPVTA